MRGAVPHGNGLWAMYAAAMPPEEEQGRQEDKETKEANLLEYNQQLQLQKQTKEAKFAMYQQQEVGYEPITASWENIKFLARAREGIAIRRDRRGVQSESQNRSNASGKLVGGNQFHTRQGEAERARIEGGNANEKQAGHRRVAKARVGRPKDDGERVDQLTRSSHEQSANNRGKGVDMDSAQASKHRTEVSSDHAELLEDPSAHGESDKGKGKGWRLKDCVNKAKNRVWLDKVRKKFKEKFFAKSTAASKNSKRKRKWRILKSWERSWMLRE